MLGFHSIVEERDRAVLIALDLQFLALIDDEASLAWVAARPVDEVVDDDFVTLAVDERIGLRGCTAESEREIADRHHDRAELHRALRAEILVSEEAPDQRSQI